MIELTILRWSFLVKFQAISRKFVILKMIAIGPLVMDIDKRESSGKI
jgi:hypothetical protein